MGESRVTILSPAGDGGGDLPDCMSCVVTENVNESFECSLTYPIFGTNYNMLRIGSRIRCKSTPYSGIYTFLVYFVSHPINGIITVKAEHISYQSAGSICKGGTEDSVGETASDIIGYLNREINSRQGVGFLSFTTDISDSIKSEFNYDKPTDGRQVMTDAAAKFGGMWEFSDYNATLRKSRGSGRTLKVSYGVNARDITLEEDITARYTHICPFWIGNATEEITDEDGQTVEVISEKQVYLSDMYVTVFGDTAFFRPYLYDCSKIFEEMPEEDDLRDEASRFAMDPANANTLGKRTKSITLDFVALKRTSEFINEPTCKAEDDIVEIGDNVQVTDRYGTVTNMICMGTTYNVLKDRYEKIDIGYRKAAEQSIEAKPKQPRTQKTIAKIERELKKIETDFKATNIPLKIEKISDNEVRASYGAIDVVRTAQGSGNERHAFSRKAYDKEGKPISEPYGYFPVEAAAAIMMSGSGGENDEYAEEKHPDELKYIDNDPDYSPEIAKESGETFDTVTETWRIDKSKQKKFCEKGIYYVGDLVVKDNTLYVCIKRHEAAKWDAEHFEQKAEVKKIVWGIGVLEKGTDQETVNRMIYPDGTQISLINFNGSGGLS